MKNMKNDKRGLSTIVTTLIIILLVFIAIGIVWVVIQDVIQGGTDTIEYQAQCLEVNLEVTSAVCVDNASECAISISRGAGGNEFAGVKIKIPNENETASFVHTEGGNIVQLETVAITAPGTGFINHNEPGITVKAYFEDGLGNQYIC